MTASASPRRRAGSSSVPGAHLDVAGRAQLQAHGAGDVDVEAGEDVVLVEVVEGREVAVGQEADGDAPRQVARPPPCRAPALASARRPAMEARASKARPTKSKTAGARLICINRMRNRPFRGMGASNGHAKQRAQSPPSMATTPLESRRHPSAKNGAGRAGRGRALATGARARIRFPRRALDRRHDPRAGGGGGGPVRASRARGAAGVGRRFAGRLRRGTCASARSAHDLLGRGDRHRRGDRRGRRAARLGGPASTDTPAACCRPTQAPAEHAAAAARDLQARGAGVVLAPRRPHRRGARGGLAGGAASTTPCAACCAQRPQLSAGAPIWTWQIDCGRLRGRPRDRRPCRVFRGHHRRPDRR